MLTKTQDGYGLGSYEGIPKKLDSGRKITPTETRAALCRIHGLSQKEAAEQMLKACPKGAILITHTPPFGIADLQRDGGHEGSMAIANAAQSLAPPLLVCGHIHNAWGMSGNIGKTLVHNLGPTINWFEL